MVDGMGCDDAIFAIGSATDWVVRDRHSGQQAVIVFSRRPAGVVLRSWPQARLVKCSVPLADDASTGTSK